MIREATLDDIDNINEIGRQYNSNFKKLFHLETEVTNDLAIVLVFKDSNIKGFLYALDFSDNIDLLYIIVDRAYQRQRIATKLIDYLITNYQLNSKSITLEVAINNEAALKLYKSFNFYEVNRRKGYYDGVDAIIMRRD